MANKAIFDCFDGYLECLDSNNSHGRFHLPIKKTKIYAYVSTLTPENRRKMLKNGNYNFSDSNYWNLDSDKLEPLLGFLSSLF